VWVCVGFGWVCGGFGWVGDEIFIILEKVSYFVLTLVILSMYSFCVSSAPPSSSSSSSLSLLLVRSPAPIRPFFLASSTLFSS